MRNAAIIKNKAIIPLLEEAVELIKITRSVDKIVLFGSQARGDFTKASDIDLAIFGNVTLGNYQVLKDRLETIRTLKRIDLVHFENANDYMKDAINKQAIILYERNKD